MIEISKPWPSTPAHDGNFIRNSSLLNGIISIEACFEFSHAKGLQFGKGSQTNYEEFVNTGKWTVSYNKRKQLIWISNRIWCTNFFSTRDPGGSKGFYKLGLTLPKLKNWVVPNWLLKRCSSIWQWQNKQTTDLWEH